MNYFVQKLIKQLHDFDVFETLCKALDDDTNLNHSLSLELKFENTKANRFLITKLQATIGGLIALNIRQDNFNAAMIMHTILPCTPLCLVNHPENIKKIIHLDLQNEEALIDKILIRAKAIKSYLEQGGNFIALYVEEYNQEIMANLLELAANYPSLTLKKVNNITPEIVGASYVVHEDEYIFLARINNSQTNQYCYSNKESKILIKNIVNSKADTDLEKLLSFMTENDINLNQILDI